jgi:hypothetical protein
MTHRPLEAIVKDLDFAAAVLDLCPEDQIEGARAKHSARLAEYNEALRAGRRPRTYPRPTLCAPAAVRPALCAPGAA